MTKQGLCQSGALGVRLFGCKPACKGRLRREAGGARRCLMNSLFSIMGDADMFSKSSSSLLLTF